MTKTRVFENYVKYFSSPAGAARKHAARLRLQGRLNRNIMKIAHSIAYEDKELIVDSDDWLFSHYRTCSTRRMVAACARVAPFLDDFCGINP